jgi:hypothetical protein
VASFLTSRDIMDVAGLVDKYRHDHATLDLYLSPEAQRNELSSVMESFYLRQGIVDVPEEAIQAAIETHTRERLTFKGFCCDLNF